MKNVFFFLLSFVTFQLVGQPSNNNPKEAFAKMTFAATTVDYGIISKGSEPTRTFNFKNTGNAPLLITDAKASCFQPSTAPPRRAVHSQGWPRSSMRSTGGRSRRWTSF